jgi:hypothetical protein
MIKQKTKEEFRVKSEQVAKKVKELIKEGNVRKITIKDKKGNVIIAFPLTIGVIGALLAPPLAAIGALVALVTECIITVERKGRPKRKAKE